MPKTVKAKLSTAQSLGTPGEIEYHFGYGFVIQEFDGDEGKLEPGEHPFKALVGEIPADMFENESAAGRMTLMPDADGSEPGVPGTGTTPPGGSEPGTGVTPPDNGGPETTAPAPKKKPVRKPKG